MAVPDSEDSGRKRKQGKRKYLNNAVSSNKKKKEFHLDVPTAEELNNLREAEDTFHSNLFKMQVDELLKELKEKSSEKDVFLKWLDDFKEFLRRIPERHQCEIKDFTLNDSVQIPILQKPESTKGVFKFIAPEIVQEIGSFVLETMCSAESLVDVAVEIPKACWQSLDFLNHRYHRKRAFYLACIAHSLLESDLVSEMKFSLQNDCYLLPVLRIIPKATSQFTVNLTAYPNEQAFKLNRFIPVRNNVRSSWMLGIEEDHNIPTPHYNAIILADVLLPKLNKYLKEEIATQNVKDGLILLKLWCKQRGLTMGYGRLNGFILTMFVSYLLKKQKINSAMNAYQIFRCSLLALQKEKLLECGISLCEEIKSDLSLEEFKKAYNVVFVELSGFLNICYAVTEETYKMVQHEAKLGLQMLDKESPDSFSLLFMHKITFSKKFEYLLHFKGAKKFKKFSEKLKCDSEIVDYGKDKISCVMPKVSRILKKGLGSRILLLDIFKAVHMPWEISEPPPNPSAGQVTIGLLLNPEVPLNNLEKGPSADDPAAKEFQNFWGSRSEMRRFQDGTIREAVYWPATTVADKRNVFLSIIKDILKRHIDAKEKDIAVVGTEVDCALHLPAHIFSEFEPYGTGEEAHTKLMQSFSSLSKQLRSLQGLPLLIASMQGTSPAFRFSEVFPPLSAEYAIDRKICFISDNVVKLKEYSPKAPPYIPALKVILNLEGSGKWPNDVDALKRVKAAFYIKIAELVKSQCSLVSVPFVTHVDIFKDGYVFRLEIACHKEIYLMKQIQMPNGLLKIKETKESHDLEISTEVLPKLNSVLHGLHQQHNTYGTACRLAKRWASAQMKHGYIHDIAIELMMAYIYIHPEPYICPCSPQVAFSRFLSLLISYDWNMTPLIVNLNHELQSKEIEEIHAEFTSQRSTLPAVVIPTPLDKRGNMWTKNAPTALILKRIRILATATLETMEKILNSPKSEDIKVIFRPPLQSYDALIYLKRKEIPRLCQAVDVLPCDELPVYKPYQHKDDEMYPVVEYDPVQKYLEELRENFHEFAHFLYDLYGGDFIAVAWKKSAFTPINFSVSHVNNRTVHHDGVSIVPDVEAILEDFRLLGSGLVKEIVKQTEKWRIP